jgi:nitrogen fixation NifU-like protein
VDLKDIYRDLILKHAKQPKNLGCIEHPDLHGEAVNRLCGDELEVMLAVRDEDVHEAKFQGRGCAIMTASASIMTELITGKTLLDLPWFNESLRTLLTGEEEPPGDLAALSPLLAMRPYRGRHQCVLLPWDALRDALSGRG